MSVDDFGMNPFHSGSLRPMTIAAASVGVILLLGALFVLVGNLDGLGRPDPASRWIFLRLFVTSEGVPIALGLCFCLYASVARLIDITPSIGRASFWSLTPNQLLLAVAAISVLAPAVLAHVASGRTPFSMDEFAARAQARAFIAGEVVTRIPIELRPWASLIRPVFMHPSADGSGWVSGYLPGYSLLLAPFERAGVPWLLNPLCNVVSLVAISAIARRWWPGETKREAVALIVLASSTQFVAAASTTYSMPVHLAVNLLWIYHANWGERSRFLAGPIGLLACCLHQPVPHVLVASPFLVRWLREKRWSSLVAVTPWYLGAMAILVWWSSLMGERLPIWGDGGVLWWPSLASWVVLLLHIVLLITWQSPMVALLLVMIPRCWRHLDPIARDLGAGIALSLVFFLFFQLLTQGHGWGWRYGHQVLGNAALLAAWTWPFVLRMHGGQAMKLLFVSVVLSLIVQFPARVIEIARYSAPFAKAHQWLASRTESALIIPVDSIWYGRDLIRNERGFHAPVLVNGNAPIPAALLQALEQEGKPVRRIHVRELMPFGLEAVGPR